MDHLPTEVIPLMLCYGTLAAGHLLYARCAPKVLSRCVKKEAQKIKKKVLESKEPSLRGQRTVDFMHR